MNLFKTPLKELLTNQDDKDFKELKLYAIENQ